MAFSLLLIKHLQYCQHQTLSEGRDSLSLLSRARMLSYILAILKLQATIIMFKDLRQDHVMATSWMYSFAPFFFFLTNFKGRIVKKKQSVVTPIPTSPQNTLNFMLPWSAIYIYIRCLWANTWTWSAKNLSNIILGHLIKNLMSQFATIFWGKSKWYFKM